MSRNSLLWFTDYTFPKFRESWHHSVLASTLERVADRKSKRVIIQAPPRHSKTEFTSRRFSAYLLGRNPDQHIIGTSYSADLAHRNNRDVQSIMEQDSFLELFPSAILPKHGSRTAKRTGGFFEMEGRDGTYRSAGVDGGITGMGFHVGIIDDPFKNRKEAESQVKRDGAWDWYTSTFLTRMDEADAAIVVIMTRWHEDDLVGRLLALAKENSEADQWEVVNLPAVMDEASAKIRTRGDNREAAEALWEDRFPASMLRAMKASQGSYDWESMYQQRPYPPGGRKIKTDRFQYIDRDDVPANVRWAFFADLAVSTKTDADYTVMGMIGFDGVDGNVYARDLLRYRKEWPQSRKMMIGYLLRHKPYLGGIEKAGQQEGFIDDLNSERKIQSIPLTLEHCPVDKDKLTRALPWIAKVDAGKFYLVNGAWVDDFIVECAKFTGTEDKHDDQIDFVSGGYELCVRTFTNLTGLMSENKEALMGMLG